MICHGRLTKCPYPMSIFLCHISLLIFNEKVSRHLSDEWISVLLCKVLVKIHQMKLWKHTGCKKLFITTLNHFISTDYWNFMNQPFHRKCINSFNSSCSALSTYLLILSIVAYLADKRDTYCTRFLQKLSDIQYENTYIMTSFDVIKLYKVDLEKTLIIIRLLLNSDASLSYRTKLTVSTITELWNFCSKTTLN